MFNIAFFNNTLKVPLKWSKEVELLVNLDIRGRFLIMVLEQIYQNSFKLNVYISDE